MKRSKIKTLKNRLWKLCRQYVKERADKRCEICGSSENLQVDHCFSRRISQLFYDVRNLTLLCGRCHTLKSFRLGGMEKRVDNWVRYREGEKFWYQAVVIASSMKPKKWTITELEDQEKMIQGFCKTQKEKNDHPHLV